MKRIAIPMLVVPLLSACAGPTVYQRECAMSFATYPEIFICTKEKLVGDPRGMGNLTTADTTELVAYGEHLNSQLRQHLITDAQARDLFAKKTQQLKARRDAAEAARSATPQH